MFSHPKDIGIIGGAGPEAGVLLVKYVIQISQEKYSCKRDKDFPYISLFSFPFAEMLNNEQKESVFTQLKALIEKECSQTKFWAIACNTLHCYLDEVYLPNHFVNMLEETSNVLTEKPIVLCSSTSKKYQIHKCYFDCDYPDQNFQSLIDWLIDELVAKEPNLSLYEKFNSMINSFGDRQLVLGCTEFSLLCHVFPNKGNIIDPLMLTAKKLCSLHFGGNNVK